MTIPKIHPNGTPAKQLCAGLDVAAEALETARLRLKLTAPNPRDYGPLDYERAFDEHLERLRHIQKVFNELKSLSVAIDRQAQP